MVHFNVLKFLRVFIPLRFSILGFVVGFVFCFFGVFFLSYVVLIKFDESGMK